MSKKSVTATDASTAAITNVRLDEEGFRKLSFNDKRTHLDAVLPRERMNLILGDTDDKKRARLRKPGPLCIKKG